MSSVLLGLGGAALGYGIGTIKSLENIRGGIAGWILLIFGLVYAVWGIIRAHQNKRHKHFDSYENGDIYVYDHKHGTVVSPAERHKVTPWVMFIIFVLGPCEPMIPLLFYPAAKSSWHSMFLLILVYTVFTLLTMLIIVVLGFYGLAFLKTEKHERYIHALSGVTIFICGAGMVFMGW